MKKNLLTVLLASSALTASGQVLVNDTNFTVGGAGGWIKLTNSSSAAGRVLGASTLTGGSNLDFSFASATNTSGGTSQQTDYNSVFRSFTSQGLAIGDKLTVDLKATANATGNNFFRQTRGLNVSFVGAADPHPTTDTASSNGDYVYPTAGAANYSLSSAATFNNNQTSAYGNRSGTSGNMLTGAGITTVNSTFGSTWTGSRYVFQIERVADIGTTSAAFKLTTTVYAPDNTTVEGSFSTTTTATNGFPTGPSVAFSALAIGSGSTSQWTNNQAIYGNLALDDVTVTYTSISAIPEPSSFSVLAGLGVLGLVALRRRR